MHWLLQRHTQASWQCFFVVCCFLSTLQAEILDDDKRMVSAVDYYCIQDDGRRFKVRNLNKENHSPLCLCQTKTFCVLFYSGGPSIQTLLLHSHQKGTFVVVPLLFLLSLKSLLKHYPSRHCYSTCDPLLFQLRWSTCVLHPELWEGGNFMLFHLCAPPRTVRGRLFLLYPRSTKGRWQSLR